MSFDRPTLAELVDAQLGEIETRLPGADARLRQSNLNVLGRVQAGGLHQMYGYLSWLAQQLFPDSAETEFLDRWASIWLPQGRKPAALAQGSVRLTGTPGTLVPAGTALTRADSFEYLTTAEVVIAANGSADVALASREAGATANADAGTALTVTTPIAGLQSSASVIAPGLTQGADEEDDAALRQRLIARIQNPPQGGSAADYVSWALEVPGVTRAWHLPALNGLGSNAVVFVRDNDASPIPDANEVAAVQAHIDAVRPVTADFTALAPAPLAVNYSVRVTPNTSAVRAAVVTALQNLHEREAEPGTPLYLSRINEAISQADGEFDHILFAPTADIVPATLQMPLCGDVTWQ
ncbi:baseplate J/gp47 family protein [Jeongeupia wiesaeckerbachi]|uniref:baseplate J/gp47 family protein n=1 Tax=Jeongeupia wiesaeckerbachi TaxID=3051218 RepID=UPI003D807522